MMSHPGIPIISKTLMDKQPNISGSAVAAGQADSDRSWIVLALLLAFPSTGLVQKYAGLAGVAAYVAGVVCAVFLVARFGALAAPWVRRHFRSVAAVAFAALAAGFFFLHPLEDGRGPGKSSDRDEGLALAVTRMADGQTPYYPRNPVAGPLSVLPGAVILASPFVALGNPGYQNVFWLAAFMGASAWIFRDKALALLLAVVPLGISPSALYEFVSGGDLIANGIYVAVFLLLALKAWTRPDTPAWSKWATCILLGIALASRSNFLLLVPLFGAALWRAVGFPKALLASGGAVLVAAALTLPFYLNDPAGFTPLLAREKMAGADHLLPWASHAMIATTALAGLVGAWVLLRFPGGDPQRAFFRWCALVTLCPVACAVALFSIVQGRPDFEFTRERFGLMYVFFALWGWGAALLNSSPCAGSPAPR